MKEVFNAGKYFFSIHSLLLKHLRSRHCVGVIRTQGMTPTLLCLLLTRSGVVCVLIRVAITLINTMANNGVGRKG